MADEAESGARAGTAADAGGAQEAPAARAAGGGEPQDAAAGGLDFVLDVPLKLTVEIGGARMLVRDVLQLAKGSVVELDRMTGDPADILVNDRLVARGEVTVMEDRLAVKVVQVVGTESPRRGGG